MGNNELMQLQLPRTFYFFDTAWHLRRRRARSPTFCAISRTPVSRSCRTDRRAYEQLRADDPASIR